MSLGEHKRDLEHCTYCPKLCRFACPTALAENKETVTPWAKMSLANMVRLGRLPGGGEEGEVFYHCLGCLHCQTHCVLGADVPGALMAARAEFLTRGGTLPAVQAVLDAFGAMGNPWKENLRSKLVESVPAEVLVDEAQAVLFAGCEAIRRGAGYLSQVFELFRVLGIDFVAAYQGPELCCGAPLWQAGSLGAWREHARKVGEALSRFKSIICLCPTCLYALRGLYPTLDSPLKARTSVVHLTQFLQPFLERHPPARKLPGKFVLHDPCYLGRFQDQVALPRAVLAGLVQEPLADLVWTGKDASCCGGGGLVPFVLPQVSADAASLRMEKLRASGAEQVVTACPGCIRQLSSTERALPVVDVFQLALRAYQH